MHPSHLLILTLHQFRDLAAMASELKARSMAAYGMPAEDVEKAYLQRLEQDKPGDTDIEGSSIGRRKLT